MQKEALLSQTVLMQYVESHHHVLKLLGCCTTDDRVALIVEYCALGNLREFLAKNRRKFQVATHSWAHIFCTYLPPCILGAINVTP